MKKTRKFAVLSTVLGCAMLILLGSGLRTVAAQEPEGSSDHPHKKPPRLVVVVSIDQFPADYLQRMRHGFHEEGLFLRVAARGAHFVQCRHQHAVTVTGPGHSVMLTGCYPSVSGIIDNGWFDRQLGRSVNCVEDVRSPLVGAATNVASDGRSPRPQLVPTVGDVLKLATAGQSRVLGVAGKDRAAILLTGHLADAAFWFEGTSGHWITSSYYGRALPPYLQAINESTAAEAYVGKRWELLDASDRYVFYRPDDSPYEAFTPPLGLAFPHVLPEQATAQYFAALRSTPFANDLTLQVARTLIQEEQLGQDDVPDLLAVGLSANDAIGHNYGPYSLEVQDVTYRTDVALGQFADFLTAHVGEHWVIVLSSDHGVSPIPEYARELGLPASREPLGSPVLLAARLEEVLRREFGEPASGAPYVQHVESECIYLNRPLPQLQGEAFLTAQRLIRDELLSDPAVAACFTREQLLSAHAQRRSDHAGSLRERFALSFHAQRSGDVMYALRPYHLPGGGSGTSHGSPWEYDRHVPLLFLGYGIRPGTYEQPASPAQIAPTLCRLLGIERPAACMVEPLPGVLETPGNQ